jgi:hypothetical protein
LGGLVDSVGAKFKSDEKALQILALARQAVGGEANIRGVQSMSVVGKATKTFDFEGAQRSEQGDWELNMQLPNKYSKTMKVSILNNGSGEKMTSTDKEVIIRRGEGDKVLLRTENGDLPKDGVVVVKKRDGEKVIVNEENTNGDIKKVVVGDELRASFEKIQHNELIRTTLALLLTTPQDVAAEYIYAGEGSVDGNSCNIIDARVGDASIVRLYLDKSSNLVRMISYTEAKPMMFFKIKKDEGDTAQTGDTKTFTRKLDAPATAEFQVKFSDYRNVNGLLLPFKWTQTVGGNADETVEITSYEINPANIAERFKEMPLPQKFMIRTKKEQ